MSSWLALEMVIGRIRAAGAEGTPGRADVQVLRGEDDQTGVEGGRGRLAAEQNHVGPEEYPISRVASRLPDFAREAVGAGAWCG